MKTFNTIFFIFVFLSTTVFGQGKDKVSPALNGFLQTDFMLKFQDMRGQAETMVKSFQAQSFQYPPSDVARVQVSYDKTARRFNQVLINIKNDFLNNDKLKLISSNPEYYSKGLELEMYQLNDFYAQNFQQTLADVTGNQIDGNPIVLLLVQLVSGISGTVDHFAKIKKEARRYNEAYLTNNLVNPYRFKMWDEISGGGGNQYTGTGQYGGGGNYNPPAYQEPTQYPSQSGFEQYPQQGYDPNTGGQSTYPQGGYDPNQPNYEQPYPQPENTGGYPQNPGNQQGGYEQYPQSPQQGGGQNGGFGTQQTQNPGYGNVPSNQQQAGGIGDWTLPASQQNSAWDGGSNTAKPKQKVAKAPKKDDGNNQ